jgi:GNAT superfamily N-acetyltransferase
MHRAMSTENMYLRFFSMSPAAAEREASRICREPAPDHLALLAWLAGKLAGVASYETAGSSGTAEVAFAVAENVHHRGVATLLLEHLVSAGQSNGVSTFTAEVLAENSAMLKVFAAAGLHARRKQADGVTEPTARVGRPIPTSAGCARDGRTDALADGLAGVADAPPGEPGGNDPQEQLPVSARPRVDPRARDRGALGLGLDVMCRPLDEYAPSRARRGVEVIDLESDLELGIGDAGAKILVRRAVLRGPEHDRSLVEPVVDRHHRGAIPAGVTDPADAARTDQPQALRLVQFLKHTA